jgi:hypothetical protein
MWKRVIMPSPLNAISSPRRGELRVWLNAVKRPVQFCGNFTLMGQVGDIGLDPRRGVETGETG